MRILFNSFDDLSDADRTELQTLATAVYPEPPAFPPREWDPGQWCVRYWTDEGVLVSSLRVCIRTGYVGRKKLQIGGIGGVKTHPDHRSKGYAKTIVTEAVDYLESVADFGLLVCKPELIPFYSLQGWEPFGGEFVVEQFGVQEVFEYNKVMLLDLQKPAPTKGKIVLPGPPW